MYTLRSALAAIAALAGGRLGVALPSIPPRQAYRGATPPRSMRKGEDGQRKPGAYSKGLRNWCNSKPSKGRM